jgi:hypothetical protein
MLLLGSQGKKAAPSVPAFHAIEDVTNVQSVNSGWPVVMDVFQIETV